jgi:hypothetical protein
MRGAPGQLRLTAHTFCCVPPDGGPCILGPFHAALATPRLVDNLAARARKLAKMRLPIFALPLREVSRSTDATSFPPQPSRGPGLLVHALRVACIAQLAH